MIFALDVDHLDDAERLVKLLAPHVGMFKVGPRLFTAHGPVVIDLINGIGSRLFLDLKFHDIPETVSAATREIARHRARMFTVHAMGGARMVKSAVDALGKMTLIPGLPLPLCLGVTILTSHTEADLGAIGFSGSLTEQAKRLALLAVNNGAGGVVASGHELATLRSVLPAGTIFVTPSIRGPGDPAGDQARVMTAKEAIEAGATYLVVGRPIRQASDPAAAAQRIVEEIESATAP